MNWLLAGVLVATFLAWAWWRLRRERLDRLEGEVAPAASPDEARELLRELGLVAGEIAGDLERRARELKELLAQADARLAALQAAGVAAGPEVRAGAAVTPIAAAGHPPRAAGPPQAAAAPSARRLGGARLPDPAEPPAASARSEKARALRLLLRQAQAPAAGLAPAAAAGGAGHPGADAVAAVVAPEAPGVAAAAGAARRSVAERIQAVADLAGQGFAPAEIARRVGMSQAEVKLVLALRRKGEGR